MSEENSSSAQSVSVYDHLARMLEAIAIVSWQKLGLQPDLTTGKIEQNLVEAKAAIDVTAYLAGVIEPELDADDRRKIQSLVRDLRINYVQKAKEQGT